MPNIKKYKSVSVPLFVHEKLIRLSKGMLEDADISITKVIEILTTKELKQSFAKDTEAPLKAYQIGRGETI